MQGGAAPDIWSQQGADIQFEPDGEQQQGDPDTGHDIEHGRGLEAEDIEGEPARQKADQRWQAQNLSDQATEEGGDDEGWIDHDGSAATTGCKATYYKEVIN
ncbi:hypothetical protein HHA01_03700 [Halomonas halmophila]|uniref:Uncharacterized protein n=1 Tax=Halomonas halmophila TaxID=252 RepID=A0A4Y4EW81_9GAMM|nr:hypothetical protein HHA01_03700 [Halomonas halmophila]